MSFESISRKYFEHNERQSALPSNYESHRAGKKWRAEHDAVEELLGWVPNGARTLDVPVGTGRLIPLLKARDFDAHGLDISTDMLTQARSQADGSALRMWLGEGDIRRIPFPDGHFDLVSCLRFLNWIDQDGVTAAVGELNRVSRDKILLGVRYLPALSRYGFSRLGVVRALMRLARIPHVLASRWDLAYHKEKFVRDLFATLGLKVVDSRLVERRWDGTDYMFFLLVKKEAA